MDALNYAFAQYGRTQSTKINGHKMETRSTRVQLQPSETLFLLRDLYALLQGRWSSLVTENSLGGRFACMRCNFFVGAAVDAETKKWHKRSVYLCGPCASVKKLQATGATRPPQRSPYSSKIACTVPADTCSHNLIAGLGLVS